MTWPRLQVINSADSSPSSEKVEKKYSPAPSPSTSSSSKMTPIPIAPKPMQKPLTFDDAKNMRLDTGQVTQTRTAQGGITTTIPLVVVTSNVPKPTTVSMSSTDKYPPKGVSITYMCSIYSTGLFPLLQLWTNDFYFLLSSVLEILILVVIVFFRVRIS